MKQAQRFILLITAGMLVLGAGRAVADEIRVAVASNFSETFKVIARQFELHTGHKVILITGSSGKHYAQIRNGAPFDAFFSADLKRPQLLEHEGLTLAQSRFTYALGKLILWSPQAGYVDPNGDVLANKKIRYLAIANPKLAPYGRAAQEVLQAQGQWRSFQGRLVRGENIGQRFQFVKSGNVALGLIAYSQVKRPGRSIEGSYWEIPQTHYSPIVQQAVQLQESPATREFLSFVRGEASLQTIRSFGYGAPNAE